MREPACHLFGIPSFRFYALADEVKNATGRTSPNPRARPSPSQELEVVSGWQGVENGENLVSCEYHLDIRDKCSIIHLADYWSNSGGPGKTCEGVCPSAAER